MQTSTNGAQKLQFKPRKTSTEIQPDAPEGGWKARIVKGKSKVTVTQNGDPRLVVPMKLETAHEEKNEKFQGVEVQFGAIVFDDADDSKRRAANINKRELRALIEACGEDFADVYPTSVESAADFDPIIEAIEGKTLDVWTVHSSYTAASGEEVNKIEIRFKKPGGGLVTKSSDDEDEAPAARRGGKKSTRR
jgi:hypothetical protein